MLRWFRPKRVYIVWETNPDPRACEKYVAYVEHVFYSRRECEKYVAYVQAEWAAIDKSVQVYFTSHVVIG